MANKDLEFTLRFKNEARQVLQQARQDLKGLGQEAAIVGTQLRQMSGAGSAVNAAMMQTATGAQKAEIAQKKLELQQARLELQSQKLAQQQTGLALGEQRLALSTERIALSRKRLEEAQKNLNTHMQKGNAVYSAATGILVRLGTALAAAFSVAGLVSTADKYTVLSTSIRNVTASAAEYKEVFDDLFAVSQKYGASFSDTVDGYNKLNISVSDSIKASFDLVKVNELLMRGFAASGTSAQTAAGATLQLTQGLATNFKAAGQELTSIIEGAPLLAKEIAVQLGGKSAADLKLFAEQGKLTSKVFLQALIDAETAIGKFEIPTTVERSIQRVKNAFLTFMGENETFIEGARFLSSALDGIAEHMDTLMKIVSVAAITAIPALTFAIGTGLVAAFKALTVVIATNPIGAIVTGITFAVAAIYTFREEIYDLGVAIKEFAVDKATRIFAVFSDTIVGTFTGAIAVIRGFIAKAEIEFFKLTDSIAQTNLGKRLGISAYDLGPDFLQKIKLAGKSASENFQDAFIATAENGRYAKILIEDLKPDKKYGPFLPSAGKKNKPKKGEGNSGNTVTTETKEQKSFITDVNNRIEAMKEEMKWIGKSSKERERATTILKLQQDAIKAGLKDFDPSEYIAAYDALHAAQEKVHTDFMSGWKAAMQDFAENAKGLGDIAQDIFKQASDGISSTITGLVDGSINSFSSLREAVGGILKDLAGTIARFVVQQQILMPLLNMFGFGGGSSSALNFGPGGSTYLLSAQGNAFTQGMPVKYFAKGGVLDGPTAFPMRNGAAIGGEAGAEGLLPLKRLSNGDLGVQSDGAGAGGTTQLNYSPVFSIAIEGGVGNGSGDKQVASQLSKILDDEGKKMVLRVITEQQRPGGLLAGGRGKTA